MDNKQDKGKAIDTAIVQIERSFGRGSIMRLGDDTITEVETISTGSLGLDYALGVGGMGWAGQFAGASLLALLLEHLLVLLPEPPVGSTVK